MFLLRPPPFADESLSSWRQRSGFANGFRLFPRPPGVRNHGELDLLPKSGEAQWLADEFLLTLNTLYSISLDAVGAAIHRDYSNVPKRPWILPISTARTITAGGVCCPLCLQSDDIPYYRLSWRFAFVTHCPVHGCQMIERCRSCSTSVWPSNSSKLLSKPPADFRCCQVCGDEFAPPTDFDERGQMVSAQLLDCLRNGIVPDGFYKGATTQDAFAALWCICQLLLRKKTRFILHKEFGVPIEACTSWDGFVKIESASIAARAVVLKAAFGLLLNWPHNFLRVAHAENLCFSHFTATKALQPHWLSDTVANELVKRARGITPQLVQSTIRQLQSEGQQIRKSSVRRALGVTESRAIDAVVEHRRRATERELATICQKYDGQIGVVSSARTQRVSMCRDYLILLLSALFAERIESICILTRAEVKGRLAGLATGLGAKSAVFRDVYARAELLSREPSMWGLAEQQEEPSFVSRFGQRLQGHTVRARIAKDMRDSLPSELWNSADVFLSCFVAAPAEKC